MNILITGAGSGIGKASAIALAAQGYRVIATGKTLESLRELQERGIECQELDITNTQHRAQIAHMELDVVICSAAIGESGPLIEIPIDRLRNEFEVNVISTLAVAQEAAKGMIARRSGRIIVLGSTAGLVTLPMLGAYNATKFALESMADSLRMELTRFGVHVSLIEPGKIDTGFNQRMTARKYEWLGDDSVYSADISNMRKLDESFFANEYDVSEVVKGIMHAVTAKRPKPRYITPPQVGIQVRLAAMLPDRLRDWIFTRAAWLR